MDLKAVEIVEVENELEETMSLNHSRLTFRLSYLLASYDDEFDIMPELELELLTGRAKPDISIFPNLNYNWEEDIIRFTQPPICAIEILSPTQAFDELTTNALPAVTVPAVTPSNTAISELEITVDPIVNVESRVRFPV